MQQQGQLLSTSEAAATLTVGTDAFRNERKRVSSRLRYIAGITVVGGNAINECAVDVYIEDYYVGRFRNSRNGVAAAIMPDDLQPIRAAACPPGSQLTCIIAIAPTVSPLLIQLMGSEV